MITTKSIAFYTFFLASLLINISVYAQISIPMEQSLDYLNRIYYQNKFEEVIEKGEALLKKVPRTERAGLLKLIADSYRNTNNDLKAERNYSIYAALTKTPEAWYEYAMCMKNNGKYDKARTLLKKYYKEGDSLKLKMFLTSCDSLEKWNNKREERYEIRKVPELNTEYRDFSPFFYGKDKLYLVSDRLNSRSRKSKKNPNPDVYEVPFNANQDIIDTTLLELIKIPEGINTNRLEGTIAINNEFDEVFLTRTIDDEIETNDERRFVLNIYILRKEEDGWTEPKLIFPFSSPNFSTAHPSLSEDGKRVYFMWDDDDGYGGADIYYSEKKDNYWKTPVNLGDVVNTSGNELFPHINGDTLYFTSDGHPGFGRFDIFSTYYDRNTGKWTTPVNLKPPVNSKYDDYAFVNYGFDHEVGLFSSNRTEGANNDDIYAFNLKDIETLYIDGTIVKFKSSQFFDNVDHEISKKLELIEYDREPHFIYFNPEKNEQYTVDFKKEGFLENKIQYSYIPDISMNEIFHAEVKTTESPLKIDGILKNEGFVMPKQEVFVLKNKIPIDTLLTDNNGRYKYYVDKGSDIELVAFTKRGKQEFEKITFRQIDIFVLSSEIRTHIEKAPVSTKINKNNHRNFVTDNVGHVKMYARPGNEVYALVEKEGYLSYDTTFILNQDSVNTPLVIYVYLNKKRSFDFVGRVMYLETGIGGASVMIRTTKTEPITLTTNENGYFTTNLYDKEKYTFLINKSGYFQTDTSFIVKLSNDTTYFYLQKLKENVDVAINDIYFDFNSHKISSASYENLNHLITFLNSNPNLVIEVNSHTDERGSNDYNMKLSKKRAEEVAKFLVQNGINQFRLTHKGFGEENLVVQAAKTEEEHEKNRRTQFKVIGNMDFTAYEPEKFISTNESQYVIKYTQSTTYIDKNHPVLKKYRDYWIVLSENGLLYLGKPTINEGLAKKTVQDIQKMGFIDAEIIKFKNKKEEY